MVCSSPPRLALALSLTFLPSTLGFSFTTSTPTQCGQVVVQWFVSLILPYQYVLTPYAGQAGSHHFNSFSYPYVPRTQFTHADEEQTIQVNNGHIQNISIPSSASNSYTFDLTQPSGLQFVATMYDSTGWGSGGTTPVLSASVHCSPIWT